MSKYMQNYLKMDLMMYLKKECQLFIEELSLLPISYFTVHCSHFAKGNKFQHITRILVILCQG